MRKLEDAKKLADESLSPEKWKQVSDLAMENGNFTIAEDCMAQAKDYNGLLLYYSCINNSAKLKDLAEISECSGYFNVSFSSYFLLNNLEKCLEILIKSNRYPEGALFCRTYYPSKLNYILELWNYEINSEDSKSRTGNLKKIIF